MVARLTAHLKKLIPARRLRPRPVRQRFRDFRAVGVANNSFLETLSALAERARSPWPVQPGTLAAAYESLTRPIEMMVERLVAMSGGRYASLRLRVEQLERELGREFLGLQAIEYGPLIMWPRGRDALHPQEVGPKAARLDAVTRLTPMHVPPYFVVSIYGYRLFMEATGLHDLAAERFTTLDRRDPEEVARVAAELQDAVMKATVPATLATEIVGAYRRLVREHPSLYGVAVRSSSVVEDSVSSFAGQFASVLNVDEAGLLDAYKSVVASKFRLGALHYANARGFLQQEIAMPVLIMAMVPAVVSGVAYSRDPQCDGCALVTAVRGLAQPIVEGKVVPDRIVVARRGPTRVVEVTAGSRRRALRCEERAGLIETVENHDASVPTLSEEDAIWIADHAWVLEERFGAPQDIEWAKDGDGTVFIVQARPLALSPQDGLESRVEISESDATLFARAVPAAGGVAAGPVVRGSADGGLRGLPPGAVLVVPTSDPRLAEVVSRVGAIVAAAGSPTGHMATVAREFGVPCVVGVGEAAAALADGDIVTVDGWTGAIYLGQVGKLLDMAVRGDAAAPSDDPEKSALLKLVNKVSPLTLTDPESPSFRPASCTTLHDVARFVHQRAMAEMFSIERLFGSEERAARRLLWKLPAEVLVLDLGGGLAAGGSRTVTPAQIVSAPFRALFEGMTDPRLRVSGPVGFDLKGFVSVVVRSAADDQRYGEPIYVLCSSDYVHFASRLAYHFATVDAVAGTILNENYARFLFYGGAAVAERREHRARFLAAVLAGHDFTVTQSGDRVEAWLGKRPAEAILDGLTVLGRLMMAARQLDMVMVNQSAAESFAHAFLAGDFTFKTVHRDESGRG